MSKHFTLHKFFCFILFTGASMGAMNAQTVEYLDANNVKAGIGTGGNLFTTTMPTTTWSLFEVPAGSGKKQIFTAALWMSGLGNGGNLHCAANEYFEYGNDYFDGPVAAVYNSNYDNYYKRVFKVTQTQIYHFKQLSFPAVASQVDAAIKYWPGKGNVCVLNDFGVNISSPLAPFVDLNQNGIYEPLLGEYPAVIADANIFFVLNDIRGIHTESTGTPLGVEIRGMASSYLDDYYYLASYNSPLNNTVFVQYEIENKSATTYNDYHLGMYVDPDIGCFNNDYVGCDTNRAMMFAYNGTPTDPDCTPELGYGSTQVALGVQILNKPLDVFGCFAGAGGSNVNGVGNTAGIYNEFLHGYWGDGTPFVSGGTGYNTGGAITKFIFPGDPTDAIGWSEPEVGDPPGDRRMFGGVSDLTFSPGEVKHFDLAFTSAYDNTASNLSIVDTLKRSADIIRRVYNEDIVPAQQALSINEVPAVNQLNVSLYPNPAHNEVLIECNTDMQTVELLDVAGRVLLTKTVGTRKILLPVNTLAKGVYLVNVLGNGSSVIKKMVVE